MLFTRRNTRADENCPCFRDRLWTCQINLQKCLQSRAFFCRATNKISSCAQPAHTLTPEVCIFDGYCNETFKIILRSGSRVFSRCPSDKYPSKLNSKSQPPISREDSAIQSNHTLTINARKLCSNNPSLPLYCSLPPSSRPDSIPRNIRPPIHNPNVSRGVALGIHVSAVTRHG